MGCIVRAGAVPQERHGWEKAMYMRAPFHTGWDGMVWDGMVT